MRFLQLLRRINAELFCSLFENRKETIITYKNKSIRSNNLSISKTTYKAQLCPQNLKLVSFFLGNNRYLWHRNTFPSWPAENCSSSQLKVLCRKATLKSCKIHRKTHAMESQFRKVY